MNEELKERLATKLARRSLPAMNLTEESKAGLIRRSLPHYRHEIAVLAAELAAAGYAVVPRVPTDAMLKAGLAKAGAVSLPDDVWPPMLAAAEEEE